MLRSENRIWNLLALKLSGEATLDDLNELNKYLEDHPGVKTVAESLDSFWNQTGEVLKVTEEMEEERFHLILEAENSDGIHNETDIIPIKNLSKSYKYKWFYAAASVIFISGIAFLLMLSCDCFTD